MTLLVDSSVWIDYFNGRETAQTTYLDTVLGYQEIVLGDLILSEVLQGFRLEKDYARARSALLKFQVLDMIGLENALQSAAFYRSLRKKGITVRKTIDCLIATFCIQRELHLLHSDHDFDAFEEHLNLKVIHP